MRSHPETMRSGSTKPGRALTFVRHSALCGKAGVLFFLDHRYGFDEIKVREVCAGVHAAAWLREG
ncbi:MAG: hypothetical protein ABSD13_13295 [Candidatus Korobacteraceae bacterium]